MDGLFRCQNWFLSIESHLLEIDLTALFRELNIRMIFALKHFARFETIYLHILAMFRYRST